MYAQSFNGAEGIKTDANTVARLLLQMGGGIGDSSVYVIFTHQMCFMLPSQTASTQR